MKRKLSLLVLFAFLFQMFSLFCPNVALAYYSTRNYGWTLGYYDEKAQKFLPTTTSITNWYSMYVYTGGPIDLIVNDTIHPGSILGFSDKAKPKDNGYPVIGDDQLDYWIYYFGGDRWYVRTYAFKDYANTISDGKVQFWNFSDVVQKCGGKGDGYTYRTVSYIRTPVPESTFTVNKKSVDKGQAVDFTLSAETFSIYGAYLYVTLENVTTGEKYMDNMEFKSSTMYSVRTKTMNYPKGSYTFKLTVRDFNYRYATDKYINVGVGEIPPPDPVDEGGGDPPPDEPPPPENEPPTARFSLPTSTYEGNTVSVTENSFDYDGQIVDWNWNFSSTNGVTHTLSHGGGPVTFDNTGTYNLSLTVTDDDGATGSVSHSINVLPAIPIANISYSGSLKENRKVVLNSVNSTTPASYPIDHTKDEWTITAISGGTGSDIRIGTKDGSTQEVLFKKAGTYRVGLKVYNSRHPSEWAYKDIIIAPDLPPVANFSKASIVFRNPSDQNYATVYLNDKTFSIDGDIISQRIWRYKFDSNNDGSFLDEPWATLDSGNITKPFLRTNKVGKYLFELEVKESFGQETIPQFITEADYRRGDTTTKPQADKITNVQNIAPLTSFSASIKQKVDVVVSVGDIAPSKFSDLDGKLNNYILQKLLTKNVNTKITTLETSGKTIDQSLNEIVWRDGASRYFVNLNDGNLPGVGLNSSGPNLISQRNSIFNEYSNDWIAFEYLGARSYISYLSGGYNNNNFMRVSGSGLGDSGAVLVVNGIKPNTNYFVSGWVRIPISGSQLSNGTFCMVNSSITDRLADIYLPTGANQTDWTYLQGTFNSGNSNKIWFRVTRGDIPYLDVTELSVREAQPDKTTEILSKLDANNIDFDVLGTDTNKAQADSIIAANSGKGVFYYNTNMDVALNNLGNYIVGKLPLSDISVSYVLLGDELGYLPSYSDYENDPKVAENWSYVHDPNFLDNNTGLSFYNNKVLSGPVGLLDKVGKYTVSYNAQDDPANSNLRFLNYRLWSDPAPTTIIVHRKPVADFSVQAGTVNVTDLSYDPDFQYRRPDKGVVQWLWKWRPVASSTWTNGKPSGITILGTYVVHLEVKDVYGAWSDPVEKTITVTDPQRPPVANFTWNPTVIYEGDTVTLTNLSSDPDGDTLTYLWTVYNPLGDTTTFTTKNVTINNVLSGTYWITLRATDPGGMSDAVTKSFEVNTLEITGYVRHTDLWNNNRLAFNRHYSGTDDSPRSYNTFWAGEEFVLEAVTTDTGLSLTKAQSVTVEFLNRGVSALLTPNAAKTRWNGAMWREDFENISDGSYVFRFTATYSNGIVKTHDVPVIISGVWSDYFKFHRNW